MTKINFYHLTRSPMQAALPKLMEKVVQAGSRAVLLFDNADEMEEYNKILWTYTTKYFLPHGSKNDSHPADQHVYLTDDFANPNEADILAIVGNSNFDDIANFEKCLYIFDGNDNEQITTARKRWKEFANNDNYELKYWQQEENGRWNEAAKS